MLHVICRVNAVCNTNYVFCVLLIRGKKPVLSYAGNYRTTCSATSSQRRFTMTRIQKQNKKIHQNSGRIARCFYYFNGPLGKLPLHVSYIHWSFIIYISRMSWAESSTSSVWNTHVAVMYYSCYTYGSIRLCGLPWTEARSKSNPSTIHNDKCIRQLCRNRFGKTRYVPRIQVPKGLRRSVV